MTKGPPTIYSEEIAAEICERLAAGETLNAICRTENMPPVRTVRRWAIEDRDGFAARYARARDMQLEFWSEAIVDLGDGVLGATDSASVQAAKLASDNRKWLLSKLRPDKYGERVTNTHAGDPNNPIVTQIKVVLVRPES